jgi:hypothetical protein
MKLFPLISASAVWFALLPAANAAAFTIDFDTLPLLPLQTNNFADAGAKQMYSSPGVFDVDGGVVLGNPTFLAPFPANGSGPNLYGTADIGHPSLLDTITFTFPLAENVTNVSGVLFNGQSIPESYVITFLSVATTLNTIATPPIPDASDALGYTNFNFSSVLPITSVTITTTNTALNGWDFFVDNVAVTTATGVPESANVWMIGGTMMVFAAEAGRRRRRNQRSKQAQA